MAGVPVIATSGVGGGFEISKNYKIDKKVFSSDDLSSILTGLSCLPKNVRSNELNYALTKIKSFIPPQNAKEIELKTNQIKIDLNPWFYNKNINSDLEIIKSAIDSTSLIVFRYFSHNGTETSRTVEPYQLVLKNSHWYLWGYCDIRNDYRLFKINRISSLLIKDQHFTLRNYEKPNLDLNSDSKTVVTRIKIRVHKTLLDTILDYCTFDDIIEKESDYYLINFPFVENDYFYGILLSFADKCECIEPLNVRTALRRKLQNIELLYQNQCE